MTGKQQRVVFHFSSNKMASRFKDLDVSVEDFISEQENESTKKKTLQNVAVLQQFLASKNEERKLEEIPPEELNEYLSEFIITVHTKGQTFLPFFLFSFHLLRLCYKRFSLYIFFICNCRKNTFNLTLSFHHSALLRDLK